jgi:hypothetical protein
LAERHTQHPITGKRDHLVVAPLVARPVTPTPIMALPATTSGPGMPFEHPFESTVVIPELGWFPRLLRLPDTRAASAIVERMLARLAPDVPSADDVARIYSHHRISPARARRVSIALWLRMLHSCLGDDVITDAELHYLSALRLALNLRERDVDDLWESETADLYRAALENALEDGRLTDDEWRELDAIASGLRLSAPRRAEIASQPFAMAVQNALDGVLEDRRLTSAESAQLRELTAQLGLGADAFSSGQRRALERAELLWRIENEELPDVTVAINLQKGERCHCVFPASWYELRTRTVRSYRTGPVASIRIMKGLSYRVGSYQTHRVTADELTLIGHGTAYITNKRFLFDGAKRNTAIRFSSILSLTPYKDGVQVEKATGKSPTLMIQGDVEIVTAILAEALSRS